MKLVIPFVAGKLRPEVRELGESLDAEFADVSGSEMAYGELIAKLWRQGESFLLLEHDVVATPELLAEMWGCASPWCAAFAWRYSGPVYYGEGETKPRRPIREREFGLFLNKFDASLIPRTPHVIGAVRVRWTSVDLSILGALAQSGVKPCQHGPVIHLHQQHPAWAATMTEKDWANA